MSILLITFFIFFPLLVIYLSKKWKVVNWISPVIICYAIGLLIANLPFLNINTEIATKVSEISIPLAIALLLFTTDFVKWLKYAGSTAFSFFLCIVSVTVSSVIAYYFFADKTEESWKIAGMLIGVYTGGTPNMSAIGMALDVKEETFILLNSGDMLICSIYLLFILTIGQRVLLKFLPSFNSKFKNRNPNQNNIETNEKQTKNKFLSYLIPIILSIIVVTAGIALSKLLTGGISVVIVILSVTTFGIALSFIPKIRKIKQSYDLGEYFLLIFCLAIGSLADFQELISGSSMIIAFLAIVMISSVLLHFLLAFVFKIDADTVIITSVAAIFSPAMIAPVATAIKNKEIIVSGLTTGLVGYAVGNYLGIAVAYFLKT
ncbi:MAG: DUF819 family protein [Saprospiraceae bacterium]|nr:DUF819 family protein [Saprospiraceae bacterium]